MLWSLLIGAVAGFLAGKIMKGGGFGLIGNLVVGILGGFVGNWIFPKLGISLGGDTIGPLITATGGAVVLLFIVGLISGKKG